MEYWTPMPRERERYQSNKQLVVHDRYLLRAVRVFIDSIFSETAKPFRQAMLGPGTGSHSRSGWSDISWETERWSVTVPNLIIPQLSCLLWRGNCWLPHPKMKNQTFGVGNVCKWALAWFYEQERRNEIIKFLSKNSKPAESQLEEGDVPTEFLEVIANMDPENQDTFKGVLQKAMSILADRAATEPREPEPREPAQSSSARAPKSEQEEEANAAGRSESEREACTKVGVTCLQTGILCCSYYVMGPD